MGHNLKNILAEAIPQDKIEKIKTIQPNDVITVYHGTIISRLPMLINGFDATTVYRRDYNGPKHRGLFVTADFDVARQFGGGAIIQIDIRSKFIHGSDYSGRTERDQEQAQGKDIHDWIREKFPNSFRPYMSYTMLQRPEPQGLLIGVVNPRQIPFVWVREDGELKKYSREEYLAKEKAYSVKRVTTKSGHQYIEKKFKNANIDLANPNIKLEDFLEAYASAHGDDDMESAAENLEVVKRYAEVGVEDVRNLLRMMKIGGSSLGGLALENLTDQVMKVYQKTKNESKKQKNISSLLEYLFETGADTMTDKRIQNIQNAWVSKNEKTIPKNEISWFPSKELVKYRSHKNTHSNTKNNNDIFDPKRPLIMIIGKKKISIYNQSKNRISNAVRQGIPYIPVKFYYSNN